MATTRQRPPEDNYDPSHTTSGGSSGKFGLFLLKEGVNGIVKKPSWNGTLTTFRPFPYLDREDPNHKFAPYRLDPGGKNVFGPWIRRYDCAWSVGLGSDKITFLISDPATRGPSFDPWTTPLGVLYRAVEQACKTGHSRTAEWQPLREGANNKGRPLTGPSELYLMQGVILVIDDKVMYGQGKSPIGWKSGTGPNCETCFMALSKGLGEKLIAELSKENADFHGDPDDFEGRYVHGDPVHPEHGRYFNFFQKGHDPRNKYQSLPTGPQPSWADVQPGEVGSTGHKPPDDKGFDLYIEQVFRGMPSQLTRPDQLDKIREKVIYWPDALWFPSIIEQAKMLWKIFPKSACVYSWEKFNSGWIDAEMWAEFRGAVSVQVPGNPGHTAPQVVSVDEWDAPTVPEEAPWGGPAVTPATPAAATTFQAPAAPTAHQSAKPKPVHAGPDAFAPDGQDAVVPGHDLANVPSTGSTQQAVVDPFAVETGFDVPPAEQAGDAGVSTIAKVAAARARAKQGSPPPAPAPAGGK